MISRNKILIIISIFVFALLVGSTSSFAVTGINVNGVTLDIPDFSSVVEEYEYYIVYKGFSTGTLFLVLCNSEPFLSDTAIQCDYPTRYKYNNDWVLDEIYDYKNFTFPSASISDCSAIYYSNFDIKGYDGIVYYSATPVVPDTPTIVKPQFVTTVEELQTGKIDSLVIKANDFNNYEKITLSIAEINRPITDDTEIIYHNNIKNYDLYSIATFNDFTHFVVDSSKLNYSFENGKEYVIYITSGSTFSDSYGYVEPSDEILDILYFTVGGLSEEEILQEKQDITNGLLEEQQEILKEQNETSKGIWGTIKEMLSYLNPFSKNFFAYKLVELILDGLKSLFIPEDGFFETFFEDMKNWFSDRLGFLFYPFELIIDILNRILNINFTEPIFNIPDIKEPFTDTKLISATTYNLNDMLSNSTLENIHNIYLVVVDAIIIFALVNLAKRKFEEVTDK